VAGGTILANTAVVSTTVTESNYDNNESQAATTINDLEPAAIQGPDEFCDGDAGLIFSVMAVTGAGGYEWTVPAGSIITGGQGTHTITMTAGVTSGNVCVQVTNGTCWSSSVCRTVTIKTVSPRPVFE
jgi:hypothetical protein